MKVLWACAWVCLAVFVVELLWVPFQIWKHEAPVFVPAYIAFGQGIVALGASLAAFARRPDSTLRLGIFYAAIGIPIPTIWLGAFAGKYALFLPIAIWFSAASWLLRSAGERVF